MCYIFYCLLQNFWHCMMLPPLPLTIDIDYNIKRTFELLIMFLQQNGRRLLAVMSIRAGSVTNTAAAAAILIERSKYRSSLWFKLTKTTKSRGHNLTFKVHSKTIRGSDGRLEIMRLERLCYLQCDPQATTLIHHKNITITVYIVNLFLDTKTIILQKKADTFNNYYLTEYYSNQIITFDKTIVSIT